MRIILTVDSVLENRNMSQKTLSELTGLRPSTISEICNNQRSVINKEHLALIAEVLDITDVALLIKIIV